MKTLYHYTSQYHLPHILKAGFLKLTDSNLTRIPNNKPYVVWLTSTLDSKKNRLGLDGGLDKHAIRFHIPMQPHFMNWNNFKKKHKHDKPWIKVLEKGHGSATWWVSPQIITMDDIYKIENTYTGEVLFLNPSFEK